MCVIVDTDIVAELWEIGGTPIGRALREAIEEDGLLLAVGGDEFYDELANGSGRMQEWIRELSYTGSLTEVDSALVNHEAEAIRKMRSTGTLRVRSNDIHLLALARIAGARLLFSRDRKLRDDFKDPLLINGPRGKVLNSTLDSNLTRARKAMLDDRSLCRPK